MSRPEPTLNGRPVKVVDGSNAQAADTAENQKRYSQSSQQKEGCGFPVVKFVVLFCLGCGAILELALGNLHYHDLRLFRQLWDTLKKGDILLGDRGFGEYTTLGLEELRCKSPEMVEKELLAYLVAHNIIRCIMAEAASVHEAPLERISFKGSLDSVRQYSRAMAQAKTKAMANQLWADLLLNLVRDLVPLRPDRNEPRATKKRPKPYPLLTKPRHRFQEVPHRNRYWKNKPRNLQRLN